MQRGQCPFDFYRSERTYPQALVPTDMVSVVIEDMFWRMPDCDGFDNRHWVETLPSPLLKGKSSGNLGR